MVRILERNDSRGFAERMGQGLIKAGREAPAAFEGYQKYKDKEKKDQADKEAALDKKIKGARKFGDELLERFHPGIYENEKPYNSFHEDLKKYVTAGYSDDQAVKAALENQKSKNEFKEKSGKIQTGHGKADQGKLIGGGFGSFIDTLKEGKQRLDENAPARLERNKEKSFLNQFVEFNKGLGRGTVAQGKDIAAHPGKFAAEVGTGVGNVLAWPVDILEAGLKRGGFISPDADPNLIRQGLNKVQEWIQEGRTPEEIERSAKREMLAGFIPVGPILKGLGWLAGKFKGAPPSPTQLIGHEAPLQLTHQPGTNDPLRGLRGNIRGDVNRANEALRGQQERILAEELFTDVFPGAGRTERAAPRFAPVEVSGLGGRVAAAEEGLTGTKPKATISRIGRAEAEGRLFKPKEQADIREKQVKLFPEYEAEIAKDAAERIERMEAKRPKTPVGEAGVASRMARAETELPKAKELYQKAIARVRGLEDSIAQGGSEAGMARVEALYDMAVKELNEAEFYLKTVLNNAKTGEARVGIEGMRQAARNKMSKIEEQIAEGEVPKLALKDYNPEIIREAKALSKKKQLPAVKHEDYFTQVHEGYANEYRNRIANLNQPPAATSPASGFFPKNPEKVKDVLQKLVDHIEAENTIHRHKMALREIQQRNVARERFGKLTKQGGNERVKGLAKEALKSPEKAAEATDAAFEEAARRTKNEQLRRKILEEREYIRKRMEKEAEFLKEKKAEELKQEAAKKVESEKSQSKNEKSSGKKKKEKSAAKEAVTKASEIKEDFKEFMESLKNGGKGFFKTEIGKSFLYGVGSEWLTQELKGEELPFTPSTVATILGGRGGVYRYLFSQITRKLYHKNQKAEYKKALQQGDDEKLIRLREKMTAKLRKEAVREFQESSNS